MKGCVVDITGKIPTNFIFIHGFSPHIDYSAIITGYRVRPRPHEELSSVAYRSVLQQAKHSVQLSLVYACIMLAYCSADI